MEIRYFTDQNDLSAAMERHWQMTGTLQKVRVRLNGFFSIAAGLLVVAYGLITAPDSMLRYAMFGILAGLATYPLLSMLDRRVYRWSARRFVAGGANATLLGEHTLTASEDGLVCRNAHTETRLAWSGVEGFAEDSEYGMIYLGSASAMIIPRSSIIEGDYSALARVIREHLPRTSSFPQ